jgi:hypothetical protein
MHFLNLFSKDLVSGASSSFIGLQRLDRQSRRHEYFERAGWGTANSTGFWLTYLFIGSSMLQVEGGASTWVAALR